MIPPFDNILFESRFENRLSLVSQEVQYLNNQFNSSFFKVRDQVSINTFHLARDQRQISKLTENTEFLIKEFLKINENINNLKSSIEILADKQSNFEGKVNESLAALDKKVDSLTEQFRTFSLN